jgi:hypothetical protein
MIKRLLPIIAIALSIAVFAEKPIKIVTGTFPFIIQVVIPPSDTASVGSIQVSLGTKLGANDLLNNFSFTWNSKVGLPTGMAYTSRMNVASLTLGVFQNGLAMYGSYSVLNKAGSPIFTKKFMYK